MPYSQNLESSIVDLQILIMQHPRPKHNGSFQMKVKWKVNYRSAMLLATREGVESERTRTVTSSVHMCDGVSLSAGPSRWFQMVLFKGGT